MVVKRGREFEAAMDMASCLMLLSKVGQTEPAPKQLESGRVFACKTCNKSFSSFQALGGHRASHKKPRLTGADGVSEIPASPKKPKTHECSICGLKFPIGQALGGHMRRHRAALNDGSLVTTTRDNLVQADVAKEQSSTTSTSTGSDVVDSDSGLCLDLNLAPMGSGLDLKPEKVAPTLFYCFI